ncbi:MAG: YebC/PmpR family DNA-binding transcriptional regulator, partial [Clostridia bacterium]|nr:YebC/PmpR family DNA-binding transcriptional regulator [Clostridia bacterium]
YEEITYEGDGPSGVAVIVEATTDNRNRTAGNISKSFAETSLNVNHGGANVKVTAVCYM